MKTTTMTLREATRLIPDGAIALVGNMGELHRIHEFHPVTNPMYVSLKLERDGCYVKREMHVNTKEVIVITGT